MSVLTLDGISKRFGEVTAVAGVSLAAERGEILGFLGPNGAGKTTTLRMIMGILRPDEGSVRFAIDGAGTRVPKRRIGYLPEERGLYDDAKVLDLLVYLAGLKGIARDEGRRRALDWLERFDLGEWARRKVARLSKGMQQKVQFIASILHAPDLIVFDEPFSGLDPVFQDLFKGVIRELRDEGAAILLSSHQMNRVEELCDRIVLIHNGQEVLRGHLREIKEAAGLYTARMRFEGTAAALAEIPGVTGLHIDGDRATFTLEESVGPDSFLRNLPAALTVCELSIERPPLHDIFVRVVEGAQR
ncbi:MAG: ATP-binding cassette domain-containing protein [Candidatus Bipolaricaulota bacterium]|nr:MAG: ATP-binding cassette domain-containing protein [Candidatus Bipolaricaulota bacterium]